MAFSIGELIGYLRLDSAQFDSGIVGAQRSLNLAGESALKMGAQVDKGATALAGAGRQAGLASQNAAKLRASQLSLVAAQERYNALVETGSASTARLATAEATLIRANERVKTSTPLPAETAKTAGAVSGLAASAGSAALSLGKMALGFAALGAAFKAADMVRQAADFQRQMLLIQTQAHASAGSVAALSKAVLELSPQVGTGPDALAKALYHFKSIGQDDAAAMNDLRVAAEGAKVGNADLTDTTNALTYAIQSGITGTKDLSQTMSVFNTIVGSGDMTMSQLVEAIGTGGLLAVAKTFGVSINEVGAALAVFGDNGIKGADGATALRQTMMGFAKPAKEGAVELDKLHLSAEDLKNDLSKGGLNAAIQDLSKHLKAAGVTGTEVGAAIVNIFGRKAGAGLAVLMGSVDLWDQKLKLNQDHAANWSEAWTATTHTASFAFDKLKATFESTAVSVYNNLLPAVGSVANDMSTLLPAAFHLVGDAMVPVGMAWDAISATLKAVSPIIKDVAGALSAMQPVLGPIAAGVIAIWAGFKAGEIVRGAIVAIQTAITGMGERSILALDGVLEKWTQTGAAAAAAGVESATGAAAIAGSAETAGAAVAGAGETAAVGWAGLAGPLGAVAVLVGTVAFMFHKSAGASKEATDAAKAYKDALSGGGSEATIVDAIAKQLSDNHVPETIDALNKSLGQGAVSGADFITAVEKGGPALSVLRAKLQSVIDANNASIASQHAATAYGGPIPNIDVGKLTGQTQQAKKLLADLNTQYNTLSAAAQKELADASSFGVAASSITKTSVAAEVGSKTAATYAQMAGIVVDQNGIAAVSADVLDKAVNNVAGAYGKATQTGDGFLSALQSFSASAGTAADRAALIGATLKAANGDALNYVGAMTGAVAANQALVDGFTGDVDKITQLSSELDALGAKSGTASLSNALLAAQANATSTSLSNQDAKIKDLNNRLASGKLSAAQNASAHRQLATAQAAAGTAAARLAIEQSKLSGATGITNTEKLREVQEKLAKAYADSELAAINLDKGTIDYTKGGAPALVGQLQAIQDAAMKAAEATYQHELATKGAAKASDDAYSVYNTETRQSLIDEASKIGISQGQAKKLADTYFGMPADVKTTIEAEGTDPILTVLNDIGTLLANLTGQSWDLVINAKGNALQQLQLLNSEAVNKRNAKDTNVHGFGGTLADGWNLVGDRGPEWVDKGTGRVLTSGQTPPGAGSSRPTSVTINQYFPPSSVPDPFHSTRSLRNASAELGRQS